MSDALNGAFDDMHRFVAPQASLVYEVERAPLETSATLDAIPIALPTPSPAPATLGRPTLEQELGTTLPGQRLPATSMLGSLVSTEPFTPAVPIKASGRVQQHGDQRAKAAS